MVITAIARATHLGYSPGMHNKTDSMAFVFPCYGQICFIPQKYTIGHINS